MTLAIMERIPYAVVFLFGITIGSFLNVCICRIPEGQSIVTAPSHCMSCGNRLKWYDMVPVFSWLCLGGKCRHCKTKISIQYPLIEFINGGLWTLICIVNGLTGVSLIYCFMVSALLTLSVIDWRTYEIPLQINIFLGILGIGRLIMEPGFCMEGIIGAVCVSGFLLLLYGITGGRAIGGGDIKLMAAAGLILGWKKIILAFLLGCIIGSVIHIFRMRISHEGHVLAMGPYLSAGIFLAALWGDRWIASYLGLLGL